MTDKVYNVLFLCTGNSARSIIGEVLMNHLGQGRFKAYSAGSHPAGKVNPFAIETMRNTSLPVEGLRSKSWDEFALPGAPQLDFIFTVFDDAGEVCPTWPGKPMTARWGIEDPATVDGTDQEKRAAFQKAAKMLRRRIKLFLALPLNKIDAMSMQAKLEEIGTQ